MKKENKMKEELKEDNINDEVKENDDIKEFGNENLNSNEDACFICLKEKPNCILSPCFHSGICNICIITYINENSNCPLCKKKIKNLFLIHKEKNNYIIKEEITINK